MIAVSRRVRSLGLVLVAFVAIALFAHAYDAIDTQSLLNAIPSTNKKPSESASKPTPDAAPVATTTSSRVPKHKPTPTFIPPPVVDPFPLLANTAETPPPIPPHNVPRKDLHREYGLDVPPPLFIGFTRQWPILLQCVVSYITAGWPAENIYIVENTGVQFANTNGKLSLQNPFYLNHTTLHRLGVNILQTPTLLSFAQMQNFFLYTAHSNSWPYYFYSHQDVLVYSNEDGPDANPRPGDREWYFYDDDEKLDILFPPAAGEPGYRTIYENCVRELNTTIKREKRWAFRWFQFDHLALVNREAMDAVGGWDSFIPYYGADCDMMAKMAMDGWSMTHRRVGLINDISVNLEDLAVLYRVPGIEPSFVDPNPLPPPPPEESKPGQDGHAKAKDGAKKDDPKKEDKLDDSHTFKDSYFGALVEVGLNMTHYKYRESDHHRNTWQKSQRGGEGEPYYYDSAGFAEAFQVWVDTGLDVMRRKWGHRECDSAVGTGLKLADQWQVLPDWEK